MVKSWNRLQRLRAKLCLGFLCRFVAKLPYLRELVSGKNPLRLFEEFSHTRLRATGFHAVRLPCFDLGFLFGRQTEVIKTCACRFSGVRRALGATRLVSCEDAGCH